MKAARAMSASVLFVLVSLTQIAWAEQNVAYAATAAERNHERERSEVPEPSVTRYPDRWHTVREEPKPKPRATWAQDGYLFKYSF
jgi:hypothetical protein